MQRTQYTLNEKCISGVGSLFIQPRNSKMKLSQGSYSTHTHLLMTSHITEAQTEKSPIKNNL